MNEMKWYDYIPLSIIGFIFSVLLIGIFNLDWLITPLNLSINDNRLTILFCSLLSGICFFGMIQLGFYIWSLSLFIIDKISTIIHNKRKKV